MNTYFVEIEPEVNRIGTQKFYVDLNFPGVFFFQFKHSGNQYTEPQWIQVDPILTCAGQNMNVNCLRILTVLSRSLGKMDRWGEFCGIQKKLGYNAVHLTPIQEYGESMSHYSLADQLNIDNWFFDDIKMTKEERYEKLKYAVYSMQLDLGMLFFVDIVLNHTASNSEWIKHHPEATYNTDNCKHLYCAYLLDKALTDFDIKFSKGEVPEFEFAPYLTTEEQLNMVVEHINTKIIKPLRIYEFFYIDTDEFDSSDTIKELIMEIRHEYHEEIIIHGDEDLNKFVRENVYGEGERRYGVNIDSKKVLKLVLTLFPDKPLDFYYAKLVDLYQTYNAHAQKIVMGYMQEAIKAVRGEIHYHKIVLKDQPQVRRPNQRMLTSYFQELDNKEKTKCVHNGWSMGGDASKQDFCKKEGWFYLRRFIIAWGDSVKLRYGDCPEDSPYLWERMTEYVTSMASIFDGVRLDNAHSTPKHIAKYMLQKMRSTNLNLYVLAEFFTPSRESEAVATRELGINGLIREMQNYYNCKDLSSQCHAYGGCQEYIMGKLDDQYLDHSEGHGIQNGFNRVVMYRKIKQRYPLPVFYDMTHDNRSTIEKFPPGTISLPHLALGSFLCCSISSTYGFDIMLPKNLCVVKEKREYRMNDYFVDEESNIELKPFFITYHDSKAEKVEISCSLNNWDPIEMKKVNNTIWIYRFDEPGKHYFKFIVDGEWKSSNSYPKEGENGDNCYFFNPGSSMCTDLRPVRRILSKIHEQCNITISPIFLHHAQNCDVIQIVRRLESSAHKDYDSYCVISRANFHDQENDEVEATFELPGRLEEIVLCAYVEIPQNEIEKYVLDDEVAYEVEPFFGRVIMETEICRYAEIIEGEQFDQIKFKRMPPGFTMVLKTNSNEGLSIKQNHINKLVHELLYLPDFNNVNLETLNYSLYKCNEEELDFTDGKRGTYSIDGVPIIYAGISSYVYLIRSYKETQNLGSPLYNNIRSGNWLLDYILTRFKENENTHFVVDILSDIFETIKELPNRCKPHYFSKAICYLWNAFILGQLRKLDKKTFEWVTQDPFSVHLFESVSQFYGKVKSVKYDGFDDSLCAGLPHFATNFVRCWGRDTFIAFKGLLLVPGYHKEARDTILYFAKVTRHGLIPNLHDTGRNTRFNARDATWFFLQSIKDYVNMSGEGIDFLDETFELEFYSDDHAEHLKAVKENKPKLTMKIRDLIQHIIEKHAQGIRFREWNAGVKIDEHMKDEGFEIKIKLDPTTGFIFGGNKYNCGTWMDKMGSAPENKGLPGSPRDGAPIEITALCYSVITWLRDLNEKGDFEFNGVNVTDNLHYSYESWAAVLKDSFERCFWIPNDPTEDFMYCCNTELVNERGIYKDVFKSSDEWRCYQFRPNQAVAMAVSPELFTSKYARIALERISRYLIVPNQSLGIKTLSRSDLTYKGNYDNSDDTHGWNYHNGPEWVWPMGYYLIARKIFFDKSQQNIMKYLIPHQKQFFRSPWMSLPELTNEAGSYCADSCHAQAWSIASIIDCIYCMLS